MDTVKVIRVRLGLTQKELAEKIGLSPITVCLKENGKRDWTAKDIYRIAKLANISMDDIDIGE